MKTLVIFDVDGTLLDSAGLHHDLITAALARDGLDVTFQPWNAYRHYTDLGVLSELFRHAYGRAIAADELAHYDRAYEAALVDHLSTSKLDEIAGAKSLLAALSARDDVAIAFATGSLRRMANVKLRLLGIEADRVALATGGEQLTRDDMVRDAASLAGARAREPIDTIILGDGLWDQRAAEALGIPFIALQTGAYLFGEWPALTIPDFRNIQADDLLKLAGPVVF
ncbi:HAD family hydrolase [Neorhizobium sp. DAR64861/K0K2]|uniref:HAD family hydrolase n=1 Tax=unclassified Neorhizobium TaxID=2629175 RepID=UPI003D280BA8